MSLSACFCLFLHVLLWVGAWFKITDLTNHFLLFRKQYIPTMCIERYEILLGISKTLTKGLGEMTNFCSSFNLPLLGLLLREEPVFSRLISRPWTMQLSYILWGQRMWKRWRNNTEVFLTFLYAVFRLQFTLYLESWYSEIFTNKEGPRIS